MRMLFGTIAMWFIISGGMALATTDNPSFFAGGGSVIFGLLCLAIAGYFHHQMRK